MRALFLALSLMGCRSEPLAMTAPVASPLCACERGPAGAVGARGPAGEQGLPGADRADPVRRGNVTARPGERPLLLDLPATGGAVEAWSITAGAVQLDEDGVPLLDSVLEEYRYPSVWVIRAGGQTRVVSYESTVTGGNAPQIEADGDHVRITASGFGAAPVMWIGAAIPTH